MRHPAELAFDELIQLVTEVRDALYLSVVDDDELLDPDKCWDADTCQQVADAMRRFELVPDAVVGTE